MEKLTKRADGFYETSSGELAVSAPVFSSGTNEKMHWFEFKTHMFSDTMRVEWPIGLRFIVIPADVAVSMLRNGFVNRVNEDYITEHNSSIQATSIQNVVEPTGTDNLNMIVAEPPKEEPKVEPPKVEPPKVESTKNDSKSK